ncbi:unnamed protein product [Lathyrus sativus]|nr:unnamed protein product [Lathyrus sativus]
MEKNSKLIEHELENEIVGATSDACEKVNRNDETEVNENPKSSKKGDKGKRDEKLSVDVIRGNCNAPNEMSIQFIAPKIVDGQVEMEIAKEDVEADMRFWETSLIMYVLETNLSMHAVKNYMTRTWNFVTLSEIYYNDEEYFILKLKSCKDRDKVIMNGPYTFQNMPMVIMEWRQDFSMERDVLRTIPLWVKLP